MGTQSGASENRNRDYILRQLVYTALTITLLNVASAGKKLVGLAFSFVQQFYKYCINTKENAMMRNLNVYKIRAAGYTTVLSSDSFTRL